MHSWKNARALKQASGMPTRKRQPFSGYGDIIVHIINHNAYHRAHQARVICISGLMPPNTDYIFYQRAQH